MEGAADASHHAPRRPPTSTTAAADGEWVECFETLKKNASEMPLGSLCHTDSFSLYDSIAALELMDPKMDTGMNLHKRSAPLRSLEDALKQGLQLDGFEDAHLITIIDKILSLLAAWMKGNSLAQTVLTCLYLHDPLRIKNDKLKAFCIGISKVVELMMQVIQSVDVYEEEDYHASLLGFSLCADHTAEQSTALLDDVLATMSGQTPVEKGLMTRMKFLTLLLNGLSSASSVKNVQKTQRICRQLIDEGTAILDSTSLGIELNTSPDPIQPFVNSHLLAPTPPREIESIANDKAIHILLKTVDDLLHACNVASCNQLNSLEEFFFSFDHREPDLVVRALLYSMVVHEGKVLDRFTMDQLVSDALCTFDVTLPANDVMHKSDSDSCIEVMAYFVKCVSKVYEDLLKILCNNRARRRRKIAKFLDRIQSLCVQAHDTNTALHAIHAKTSKPLPQQLTTVVPFTNRLATKLVIDYIKSGFDLGLYQEHEYHMSWWYLDYVLQWIHRLETMALQRKQAHQNSATQTVKPTSKKGKSKKVKTKKQAPLTPSPYWQQCEVWRNLAKGLLRGLEACRINGHIKKWENEFTSLEIIYQHRFAPFELVEFPEYVTYQQYHSRTDVESSDVTAKDLFDRSALHFEQAARLAQECIGSSTPPPQGIRQDLEVLIKVAKTNAVSAKLAAMVMEQGKKPVQFDFNLHMSFPVMKYR